MPRDLAKQRDCDASELSKTAFQSAVADPAFPCVGAKSALAKGGLQVQIARDITSAWDDLCIYAALSAFVGRLHERHSPFHSFAVVFSGSPDLDEAAFELALWERAQSLSDKDVWLGNAHDGGASACPEDPKFALSFAGEAFFLVGLHPRASRPARRFPNPTLIFNPHSQFDRLRQDGKYESMRRAILDRDVALAGSENPMLARFGEVSEARQYSGRDVGSDWCCPYRSKAELAHDS